LQTTHCSDQIISPSSVLIVTFYQSGLGGNTYWKQRKKKYVLLDKSIWLQCVEGVEDDDDDEGR